MLFAFPPYHAEKLVIYSRKVARSPHSLTFVLRTTTKQSKQKMQFTIVVVAVAVLALADGYSVGAPESACKDMIPRHPVPAQKTSPPYTITTSTNVVRAGTPLEVTISGKKSTDTMRGLLLQARKGDDIVGTFTVDPNDSFAQLLDCGSPGNAITHKKHDGKFDKQSATFTWTPSEDLNGEIKFRATIALNGAVFWVGVESAPVTITH